MGVYSSIEVYPSWIDDVDASLCEYCNIQCDELGFCPFDKN
jgi:hypothetical protein